MIWNKIKFLIFGDMNEVQALVNFIADDTLTLQVTLQSVEGQDGDSIDVSDDPEVCYDICNIMSGCDHLFESLGLSPDNRTYITKD